MAHYNFKPTNSNYMLIQFDAEIHNDIENSKSSKFDGLRRASSSGIAGKFRELLT